MAVFPARCPHLRNELSQFVTRYFAAQCVELARQMDSFYDHTVLLEMTLLLVPVAALQAPAQVRDSPYPGMAPIDRYLMAPDAEIAMARSAAPESLSRDAEVMVLG